MQNSKSEFMNADVMMSEVQLLKGLTLKKSKITSLRVLQWDELAKSRAGRKKILQDAFNGNLQLLEKTSFSEAKKRGKNSKQTFWRFYLLLN